MFKPLWKKLIDLDMTKDGLRRRLDISSSILKKMKKDEYIGMKILSDIFKGIGCTLNDNIENIEDQCVVVMQNHTRSDGTKYSI